MNSLSLKLIGCARWLVLPALLCVLLSAQARAQNDSASAPAVSPRQTDASASPLPEHRAEHERRLMDALNLTPDQRAQLADLARQNRETLAAAQIRARLARRALNQAIYAENPEQTLIEQRTRELATAQAELIRLNAQTELKIRQILTPEQLRAFRALRQRQRQQQLRQRGLPGDTTQRPPRNQFPNANRQP